MSEEDDFLRQTRMARMMADSEDEDDGASVDDLRLARRMAAMQDDNEEEAPAQDDALVSEGTKQAFKKAGALAAIAGRWSAGKAKEGALLAAEKARAAKTEFDTKRLVDAERKRLEAETLAEAAAIAAVRQPQAVAAPELEGEEFRTAAGEDLVQNEKVSELGNSQPQLVAVPQQAIRKVGVAAPSKSRENLVLIFAVVVVLAATGGGAYWWSQQKPAARTVPVAAKPVVAPVPVAKPLPVQVVEPVPEPVVAPVSEPVPVAIPEPTANAEPTPVEQPVSAVPKQTLKPIAPPLKKKAAPTPIAKPKQVAPKEDWQDKAQDDMAKFEKELGIE